MMNHGMPGFRFSSTIKGEKIYVARGDMYFYWRQSLTTFLNNATQSTLNGL